MYYLLCFLEGIITFISPCMLPMLPVYLSWFSGMDPEQGERRTFRNACGFVLGFTVVFVTMGAFAGTVGAFLTRHSTVVNAVAGGLVILLGLSYLGILHLPFGAGAALQKMGTEKLRSMDFPGAILFGMAFSVGWTPCVGAFLGSALLLAASAGGSIAGIGMLLSFSIGLGIPFLLSALLIGHLGRAFHWIKTHYRVVNFVSGLVLVVTGLLMATGQMTRLLTLLA